jgi:hypothetical protein
MDAKLIEKLDSRRYKYLLWITIGFVIYMTSLIARTSLEERPAEWIIVTLAFTMFPSTVIVLVAFIQWILNEIKIRRDSVLKAALNNEMVMAYRYKSLKLGCYVALYTLLAIYASEHLMPLWITVKITCLIVSLLSVGTIMVSNLMYMRK